MYIILFVQLTLINWTSIIFVVCVTANLGEFCKENIIHSLSIHGGKTSIYRVLIQVGVEKELT